MAKVEGRLEEISKRIDEPRNNLTYRIDGLTNRIDALQKKNVLNNLKNSGNLMGISAGNQRNCVVH
jgi:hypothetical protein